MGGVQYHALESARCRDSIQQDDYHNQGYGTYIGLQGSSLALLGLRDAVGTMGESYTE
jgi:hypothetical protein